MLPNGYAAWAKGNGVEMRPTWQEYLAANGGQVAAMESLFKEMDKDQSGTLSYEQVCSLARRFFDGREPKPALVKAIFTSLGVDASKDMITLDEMLQGAQRMHRAFHASEGDVEASGVMAITSTHD